MGDLSIITAIVIGVNVLISIKGFNDYSFFEKYKFNTGAVRRGEQIRVLSSGFLHVSTSHLFFNMLTLYFFAPIVISFLGNWEFVVIYLGSLILGNLLSYYFHKDEYHYTAVGASGAVSGILYAAILLYPDMSLYMFFIPVPIPAYIFGIGYLLYSIYGMRANNDNIGHDAHFGGAVGGYVITLLMVPALFQVNTLMVGLLAIPIVILFVLNKTGRL
ncbi:rhomboid family intramembrane serine protease [Leeuwenhoekiella palythoae]|uniref:rhomboid family intramembrane serine protease n=1 Tax=Leeuwenhoekiella palythoae TaxID=573501 RepID=UPI001CE0D4CC|nr:rhomboid family intramembrane serine protease [Leeuwenhoekiella palythoae]MEC8683063.1 rhomboid family intramembrane serine protease [Bacteroidota bacterium]MEE3147735.1 rhomboid family intramembrane serine protease [Bacteroidota bacterium]MEE3225231.1 rhomboid family intramembrane serine protease [Bacteroidota bacterium]UBZ10118.1 rhomboid family intramembrane serine protease [Leeuwenhoekiella palythoae]